MECTTTKCCTALSGWLQPWCCDAPLPLLSCYLVKTYLGLPGLEAHPTLSRVACFFTRPHRPRGGASLKCYMRLASSVCVCACIFGLCLSAYWRVCPKSQRQHGLRSFHFACLQDVPNHTHPSTFVAKKSETRVCPLCASWGQPLDVVCELPSYTLRQPLPTMMCSTLPRHLANPEPRA